MQTCITSFRGTAMQPKAQPRLENRGDLVVEINYCERCCTCLHLSGIAHGESEPSTGMMSVYRVEILPRGKWNYITPTLADERVQPLDMSCVFSFVPSCSPTPYPPTHRTLPASLLPYPPLLTQRPELHSNNTNSTNNTNSKRLILKARTNTTEEDHDQLRRGSPDTITTRQPGR